MLFNYLIISAGMQKKGVSSLIGFLVLTAIAVSIMAGVFLWAAPNIQKAQNNDDVSAMENQFLQLHSAIKKSASEQARASVPFNIKKGRLFVDTNGTNNNSIVYVANLRLPQPYSRTLIGNKSEFGRLGIDEPAYFTEMGAIEMTLHYITLNDTSSNCYRISLRPGQQAATGAGSHLVFVTWASESNDGISGCIRNTTEIVDINII